MIRFSHRFLNRITAEKSTDLFLALYKGEAALLYYTLHGKELNAMKELSEIISHSIGGYSIANILSAILTLLVCLVVVRLVMKLFSRLLSRASRISDRLQKIILSCLKVLLYVLTAIITAESLGINTASLTAIMSVLTLGVTLAAEDILGNVAGGLVILSSHPFGIGDTIEAGGTVGTVREISLNHTKLETADGQIVLQPNRQLSSSKIINYTTLGRRRVVRTVTASYDAPTDTVKAACMDAVRTVPGVLSDPAPEVYLTSYGASSIEYAVRCWTSVEDYWNAYYTLNEALRDAFDKHGVEMTYDHLNVHLVPESGKTEQQS